MHLNNRIPATHQQPVHILASGENHCLRHALSFPPRRQITAYRSPVPAAFIVGAPDDDDDKHPPGGNIGAFPPSLTTTPLPLLLQNPSGKSLDFALLGLTDHW
ncbi:MAG: hypothetical protein J0L63_12035 [Anaerolineae bacterium]|nr:hypothetical protein [Anaerolineae bacterium]